MDTRSSLLPFSSGLIATPGNAIPALGILIGIVMPVVSTIFCLNFSHQIATDWIRWPRLIEVPFVMSEMVVILYAMNKGFSPSAFWKPLFPDVKIAVALLLVGLFTSSIFISAFPVQSLTVSLFTLVHILFALAVLHLAVEADAGDRAAFLNAFGAGLISLAILTVWKFNFPPPLSQVPGGIIQWDAALPGFISVRHFGSWTGAIAAGFMATLLYKHDSKRLSTDHLFYFLAAVLTVWSGTRAAILAIVITAIVVAAVHRRLPRFENCGVLAMLTGAALIVAWFLLPGNERDFLLFVPSDVASGDSFSSGRFSLWTDTFNKWTASPWFGWGSESLAWTLGKGWHHSQPHNAVLQYLFSWGLVGTSGALWLLGRAIGAACKETVANPYLTPAFAVLSALLLQSLLEGMLHYPRFIMTIMALFAIIFANKPALRSGSSLPRQG